MHPCVLERKIELRCLWQFAPKGVVLVSGTLDNEGWVKLWHSSFISLSRSLLIARDSVPFLKYVVGWALLLHVPTKNRVEDSHLAWLAL